LINIILCWQVLSFAVPLLSHHPLPKIFPNGYNRIKKRRYWNGLKQIVWIGRSKADLKEFPERVQRSVGFALWGVQGGQMPPSSKILKGFGNAKVREIIENDSNGTFRVVYTVEFKEYIAVLHAFQKKSKSGIATPQQEIELVKKRLAEAKEFLKEIE